MLYAALTFWLFVIIFSAWGVHALLTRLIKPRIVNSLLLPGTLVAQLGHVFGLLITGNEVRGASLMGDDEKGEPTSAPPDKHKIPVIGSVVVGLLPILACTGGLVFAIQWWGDSVFRHWYLANQSVATQLPLSIAGFWDLLHQSLDAMEKMLAAIARSDLTAWQTLLFLYLAICLTVRMAPFAGHQRGAVIAIALAGIVIAILGLVVPAAGRAIENSWPILSFVVALLLFLLLTAAVLTGVVSLVRLLTRRN